MSYKETVQDLGPLEGPVLIFGGPYSNLLALESLKSHAVDLQIPPENIICTGDIIGYCAHPDASLLFIKEWGIHSIYGNVEFNLVNEVEDCGCNYKEGGRCDIFSRQWYPFAKDALTEECFEYMRRLPEFISFTIGGKKVFVLHGGLEDTSEFIFESTDLSTKKRILDLTGADIIVGGHCGIPFCQNIAPNKWWINAGVIGMPANDGSTETWFGLLDDNAWEIKRLSYDASSAALEMRQVGLPESYALTLETGIWDNCEILPAIEASHQGQAIKALSFTLL